jgi:hypothetical protein
VNLLIWVELPLQLVENEAFMAALDLQASNAAAALGRKTGPRQVTDSGMPLHRVVAWDVLPPD